MADRDASQDTKAAAPSSYSTESCYDNAMRSYPLPYRAGYAVILGILYAFTKIMWRCSFDNLDKILEREDGKGAIIISNHTSMAEVVATVTLLWRRGRRVRPIFKSEFNKSGIVRWFFARVGGIPVDRGTADMKSLRRASHALARGEDILIYPEGTRIRTDDQPVEVHGGFAIIAQMAKARVIPMAVCGFRDITPNGHHLMRPVTCWLRSGNALSLDDAPAELKRRERTAWLETEAIERMYAIRDELRAEHPRRR